MGLLEFYRKIQHGVTKVKIRLPQLQKLILKKYNLAPLPHIPHTPYVSYAILERSIHTDFHYPHKLHAQNTKYGHKMRVLRGFKLLALALHTGTGAPMRKQLKSHVTQYGSAHEKRSKYTSLNGN